jgi:CheY-like chemotaxis protein
MILVVDDHHSTRDALAALLRQQGHDVRTAPSGHAALNLVRELRPDLVVLDKKMRDMSGLDVLRSINEDPSLRCTPVIVFTGDREGEAECLQAGATAYIVKSRDSMDHFWRQIRLHAGSQPASTPEGA